MIKSKNKSNLKGKLKQKEKMRETNKAEGLQIVVEKYFRRVTNRGGKHFFIILFLGAGSFPLWEKAGWLLVELEGSS